MRAIVLRRRDSGESDRRLTLLTLEEGRLEVIAKGARKGGSRLAGCSEPLTLTTMQLASGRHAAFLTQAQPITSFPALRSDFERLTAAMSIAELHGCVAQAGNVSGEAFELLEATLRAMEAHPSPRVVAVWGQVGLLSLEGIMPACDRCAVTGDPIRENPSWFSPSAGGLVSSGVADGYTDRFLVCAEALIGLAKIANLAEPPANLKYADDCLRALLPYWRQVAHAPIPATDSLLELIDHSSSCE